MLGAELPLLVVPHMPADAKVGGVHLMLTVEAMVALVAPEVMEVTAAATMPVVAGTAEGLNLLGLPAVVLPARPGAGAATHLKPWPTQWHQKGRRRPPTTLVVPAQAVMGLDRALPPPVIVATSRRL